MLTHYYHYYYYYYYYDYYATMRSPAFRSGCPGLSDTSLGPTRITTTKTTTTRMSSKNFKDNKITCRKQPEELLKEHCRNLFVAALVVVSPPRGSLALRGSSPLCPRPAPGARPKRDGMCSYSLQSLSLCLHAVFLSRSENIAVCRPPLGALLYIDISIYLSIYLSIYIWYLGALPLSPTTRRAGRG